MHQKRVSNHTKAFRCGIIYGSESSSGGGRAIFDAQGVTVNGGMFHDVQYRAEYREIELAYYSTILPKIKFKLGSGEEIPLRLNLWHTQLYKILDILCEHGVKTEKYSFLPHMGRWYRFWYGYVNQ